MEERAKDIRPLANGWLVEVDDGRPVGGYGPARGFGEAFADVAVGDKVLIYGAGDDPNLATVVRVTKTQLRTQAKGQTGERSWVKRTGNEVGAGRWDRTHVLNARVCLLPERIKLAKAVRVGDDMRDGGLVTLVGRVEVREVAGATQGAQYRILLETERGGLALLEPKAWVYLADKPKNEEDL